MEDILTWVEELIVFIPSADACITDTAKPLRLGYPIQSQQHLIGRICYLQISNLWAWKFASPVLHQGGSALLLRLER